MKYLRKVIALPFYRFWRYFDFLFIYKCIFYIYFLIASLMINSTYAQTLVDNPGKTFELKFKILESEQNIGKYINGNPDLLGFKEYDNKNTPNTLPAQNRMLTLRTDFLINDSLQKEEWVLVVPPLFYACNIYLNGILLAQRGNIKNGYTSRNHSVVSVFFPPNLLRAHNKSNELAIELLPKFGEDNSANGFFISNRRIGDTYIFWRNFFSVHFIRAMALVSFIIFLYFLIFSFKRKSENTSYYIPFSLACLAYPLATINNIINYNFSDTLLLEKLSRFGMVLWIYFTSVYIIEFTKIFKYRNYVTIGLAIITLPFIFLGWMPDNVPEVIEFNIKYTSLLIYSMVLFYTLICFLFAYRDRTKYSYILTFFYFLVIPSTVFDSYYFAVLKTKPFAFTLPYFMFLEYAIFFFIVAWEQSDIYKLALRQSKELTDINENLEQIIKQRTLKLHESEEKYRSLIEGLGEVVFRMSLPDGKYEYVSPSVIEIFGYTQEEVLNNPLLIKKLIHIDFTDYFTEKWEDLIQGKVPPLYEYKILDKAGNEKWIQQSNNPIFNEGGKIIALDGLCRDITKEKQFQLEEIKTKAQLRAILDNSNAVIYLKDKNFNYLLINKQYEELFNLKENDIIGKSDYDIHPKYIADKFREVDSRVLREEITITEEEIAEKDGRIEYFLSTKFLLRNNDNQTYAVGGISTEIGELKSRETALRYSESQLRELNATKDKFFSIISHDLKHPFNNILGFSKLLSINLHKYDEEKILQFVHLIINSAQIAYKLLENLLEWSMAQTGKINFNPEIFILESLVIDTISITESSSRAKSIEVSYEIKENIQVFADKNMINTVLRNLVTNAIKYTHQNGFINISASIQNNYAQVSVKDNGIGIKPETIEKLFKISEKISTPGTNSEKGTGLGLILCKEFIEKNKGSIWVESEVGKGSEIYFTLPLATNP